MEDKLENLSVAFKDAISRKDCKESKRIIIKLSSLFDNDLSVADIHQILLHMFDEMDGYLRWIAVPEFIKTHKDAAIQLLQLYGMVINKFPTYMRPSLVILQKRCVLLIQQSNVTSAVRENCAKVLIFMVEKAPYDFCIDFSNFFLIPRMLKATQTVEGRVFKLLGTVCKNIPGDAERHSQEFRSALLRRLENSMRERPTPTLKIEGILEAFTCYLTQFAPAREGHESFYRSLYGFIKTLADPGDAKKLTCSRAALALLQVHAQHFSRELYQDYLYWHKLLSDWLGKTYENRRSGAKTLLGFYNALSYELMLPSSASNSKIVFMYFFESFKRQLTSGTCASLELRLAIRGFGYFTRPCKLHLTSREVSYMFILIVQRMETVYLRDEELTKEDLEYLPDYVQTLCEIIIQLSEISEDDMFSLQQLCILMIKKFPEMHEFYHTTIVASFTGIVHLLATNHTTFLSQFLTKIIYQGVIWTCSHTTVLDVDLIATNRDTIVTYRSYLPLWIALLKCKQDSDKLNVRLLIYDEIFATLFNLVHKLDLSLKTIDSEESNCDPDLGLEANNPKDFTILVNVVEFYKEILQAADPEYVKKYLIVYHEEMITLSTRYPLVSGFYKLLTSGLKLWNYTNETEEATKCMIRLERHIRQVLYKLHDFDGDLHLSMLEIVLACPVELVPNLLPLIIPALGRVFAIGTSYLSLALVAMDALETWRKTIPKADVTNLLEAIVPLLDTFIRSKRYGGDTELKIDEPARKQKQRPLLKKRITIKRDTELAQLQRRILVFLGSIDLNTTTRVLSTGNNTMKFQISKGHILKYNIPFADMKPGIFLDDLLPRVLEIAVTCSDRKTRIVACELLHTIVIYFVGIHKQVAIGKEDKFTVMFRTLCPYLLELACDPDQVVHQLFDPLMRQLIHWFTSRWQSHRSEGDILVVTLMHSITHSTNKSLCDYAGKSLREYADWAIRQSNYHTNLNTVIDQIILYATHPKTEKRYGAALAFNNLVRILQVQEQVIDMYWLQLLHAFVGSLSLAGNRSSTLLQVSVAIDKLVQGLEKHSSVFTKINSQRRKPDGFERILLVDIVKWLLYQCGSPPTDYRQKCMKLFLKLTKYVDGYRKPEQFISNVIQSSGTNDLWKIFENNLQLEGENFNQLKTLIKWLNQLQASLDGYTWIFKNDLLKPLHYPCFDETHLFIAIHLFVCKVACCDIREELTNENFIEKMHIINDQFEYENLRATLILNVFDFLTTILGKKWSDGSVHPTSILWGDSFWRLISVSIFEPQNIGFTDYMSEEFKLLTSKLSTLLVKLKQILSDEHINRLCQVLDEYLKNISLLSKIGQIVQTQTVVMADYVLIDGLIMLRQSELLPLCSVTVATPEALLQEIFKSICEERPAGIMGKTMQESTIKVLNRYITFASYDCAPHSVLNLVQNATPIKHPIQRTEIHHGVYFVTLFKESLMQIVLKNSPQDILNLPTDNLVKTMNIALEILQFLQANKLAYKPHAMQMLNYVLTNWRELEPAPASIKGNERLLRLLRALILTTQNPINKLNTHKSGIDQWILGQLLYVDEAVYEIEMLSFKSKVLTLLPCLTGPDDTHNVHLRETLRSFSIMHLQKPLNEMLINSSEYISHISVFQRILDALKITSSPVLLEFVIDTCIKRQDIYKTLALQALQKFIKSLDNDRQINALNLVYELFACGQYNGLPRLHIVQNYLITLLNNTRVAAVENFLVPKLETLLTCAQLDLQQQESPHSEEQITEIVIEKIATFNMLECLFDLDKRVWNEASSSTYTDSTLTKQLIAICFKAFKHHVPCGDLELVRRLYCAIYKTLVAAVSNTQTDLKFYPALFYQGSRIDTTDQLWPRLIDCSAEIHFPQDFDQLPSKRKEVIRVRHTIRKRLANAAPTAHSLEYISTQNVFNSTLKEDVTKYDFTTSLVKNQSYFDNLSDIPISRLDTERVRFELEEDTLNRHECMATICALMQHIASLQEQAEGSGSSTDLPTWMQAIRKVLTQEHTHANIKIFLIKVIENNNDIFKPFAKWFIRIILHTIAEKSCGESLNYFINDLILMLVEWQFTQFGPTDKTALSQLLAFLVPRCCHERTDMFKYNIELLKSIVEYWKINISLSGELFEYFRTVQEITETRLIQTQINTAAIFVINGIAVWNDDTKRAFQSMLLTYLKSTDNYIYIPCAELIGMMFKLFDPELDGYLLDNEKQFLKDVSFFIEGLPAADLMSNMYGSLNAVHKFYPPVVDDTFLRVLLSNVQQLSGRLKEISLQMIASRLPLYFNRVRDTVTIAFLRDILQDPDVAIQELGLTIINKIILQMDEAQFEESFKIVSTYANHNYSGCRNIVCDMMIVVYKQLELSTNDNSRKLWTISRNILLLGLVDTDEKIQSKIFAFWKQYLKLAPSDFVMAFKTLHSNQTEMFYLGQCLYFLLELTDQSPDYERKVFENALSNCTFDNYEFLINWRAQHAHAPLFADSIGSQLLRATRKAGSIETAPQLYATLTSSFATQQLPPTDVGDQTSLMFTPKTATMHGMSNAGERGDQFQRPNLPTRARNKYRFLRNTHVTGKTFAMAQHVKNARQTKLKRDLAQHNASNVTMLRKYRTGDFPDVEITNKSIIIPLQALARCDAVAARVFFVSIFNALVEPMAVESKENFLRSAGLLFNEVLTSTDVFSTNMVGAFLELSLKFRTHITLEPSVIVQASQQSGLLSLGCVLLEETLSDGVDLEQPVNKKSSSHVSVETQHWLKLADLYRSLSEADVVNGIFSDKIGLDVIKRAMKHESRNEWSIARDLYFQTITSSSPAATADSLREFYHEAYFTCFAQLSDWNNLSTNLKRVVDELDTLWTIDWNREKLLPWMFKAELHKMLIGGPDDLEFKNHLQSCLMDREKAEYLKGNFPVELTLYSLLQGRRDKATFYADYSETMFLENWANLNPNFTTMRAVHMKQLQRLTEINNFLAFQKSVSDTNYRTKIGEILEQWSSALRVSCNSLLLLEDRVLMRNTFTNQILDECLKCKWELGPMENDLKSAMVNSTLELVNFAIKQGNFYIARKYFKKLHDVRDNVHMEVQIGIAKCRLHLLKVDSESDQSACKNLRAAWSILDSVVSKTSNDGSDYVDCCIAEYAILSKISDRTDITSQHFQQLIESIGYEPNSCFTSLTKLVNVCTRLSTSGEHKAMLIDAYLELAQFCQRNYSDSVLHLQEMIKAVLKSMRLGAAQARLLFPWLLTRLDVCDSLVVCFKNESEDIPEWMFLSWMPQLLTTIESKCRDATLPLILRIAKAYPKAMSYIYRLSREFWSPQSQSLEIVQSLDKLLLPPPETDWIGTLLRALACANLPEVLLSHYLRKLLIAFQRNDQNLQKIYENLMLNVYPTNTQHQKLYGNAFRRIKHHEKTLSSLWASKNKDKLLVLYQEVDASIGKQCGSSFFLNDYSPWLHAFHTLKFTDTIEIPGQYTGERRPLPQYHVQMVRFKEKMQVLTSLRRPIKVGIIGSDSNEYHFLLKFGEDLRQDQRIQQLLSLMNSMLQQEFSYKVSITTYKVIPLTSCLGIIEWLNNTNTMGEFGFVNCKLDRQKAIIDYKNWIMAKGDYMVARQKYTKAETIYKYNELRRFIPRNSFKNAFWELSVSAELFFVLRQNFVTSYAAMCISHWLLGVGDRHLSNQLIDLKNGTVIGIDFGYAFGIGTEKLRVPELIPFRLTPQIMDLLQPFGEVGIFKETMKRALIIYRKNSESLLSVMEVFVKEPTVDWLDNTKDKFGNDDGWYPRKKVDLAKRKLMGANPVRITVDELRNNTHLTEDMFKANKKIVEGCKETGDIRAIHSSDGLIEEDQIDCLLNLATDPYVLGGLFQGWEAWV